MTPGRGAAPANDEPRRGDRVVRRPERPLADALVTDDIGFRLLESEHRARGDIHHGVVFTSNKRFPRGQPRTVGRLGCRTNPFGPMGNRGVNALDRFLSGEATGLARTRSFTD